MNIPTPHTYIENLLQIASLASDNWIKADFRFDRIVFTNLAVGQTFLQTISFTEWGKPKIICSPHQAYDLDAIFRILGPDAPKTKLEILCGDTPEEKTSLGYFLEDKLPEYALETPPRCSLVHPNYEIDYKIVSKKYKRRTRKPPAPFQRFLKRKAPNRYPQIIGNDYYARPVFQAFANLKISQESTAEEERIKEESRLPLPMPASPLKYYDLQAPQEGIEFRFDKYISMEKFTA
ncbi:MAG: hypothetical protein KAR20_11265, partial [Candidatus Heimdallarchaeota archaeon]|nr:hypothetical protein [Candidatus Heimdallarchaeota archaeon]